MGRDNFVLKVLIFFVVGSYFAYALYWFVKTIPWIIEISLRPEFFSPPTGLRLTNFYSVSAAYLMEYSSFFGLIIRVVGASYALLSVFLILKSKANSLLSVRNKISKALLLEGLHFLSFIPVIFFLLRFSALPVVSYILLSIMLIMQILLISPFLVILSLKVSKYESGEDGSSLQQWSGLAAMNYVIALLVTYILKWTEMSAVDPYLFSAFSIRIFGFLNTIIFQSLAVSFAVVGFVHIFRKSGANKKMKWWGLSAIFLSAHLILYIVYVAIVGIPRFISFGELWVIPLLGFGIYVLLLRKRL